jgi:hypothetical protein
MSPAVWLSSILSSYKIIGSGTYGSLVATSFKENEEIQKVLEDLIAYFTFTKNWGFSSARTA